MKHLVLEFIKNEDGFIGALIGGAVSLFGANKKSNDAKAARATHFQSHRKSAEAAGFNPLTALEATGGQLGNYGGGAAPLASYELIAEGIKGAADHFTSKGDEVAEVSKQKAENELLRVELDQARSGVAVPKNTASAQSAPVQLTTRRQAASPVTNVRKEVGGQIFYEDANTEGNPSYDRVGNPRTPALTFGDTTYQTDPGTSDAEISEQRYGDIGQEVAGAVTAFNDFNHNFPTRQAKETAVFNGVKTIAPYVAPLMPGNHQWTADQVREFDRQAREASPEYFLQLEEDRKLAAKRKELTDSPYINVPRKGPRERAENRYRSRR